MLCSDTFEDYNALAGAALLCDTSANLHGLLRLIEIKWAWFKGTPHPQLLQHLNQLKKPSRCACITAQLQLEHCSPQGCQILAAAQENLA